MKSPREVNIDITLIDLVESLNLSENAMKCLKILLSNEEVQASQEFANTVSISRLGFNDHGPVHMRKTTHNGIIMMDLLRKAKIKTSMEADRCGDFEDGLIAVMIATMLHDIGMGMGRENHELHGLIMAHSIVDRVLSQVYHNDLKKRVMIRAVALEGIAGHMGTLTVSSLEAGIVQVADGCDMTKGRARIQIELTASQKSGHIHQFSANSIEEVNITAGKEKPIRLDVNMSSEVGLFQVEEVLLHKIAKSTAKQHIELYAHVGENTSKRYL